MLLEVCRLWKVTFGAFKGEVSNEIDIVNQCCFDRCHKFQDVLVHWHWTFPAKDYYIKVDWICWFSTMGAYAKVRCRERRTNLCATSYACVYNKVKLNRLLSLGLAKMCREERREREGGTERKPNKAFLSSRIILWDTTNGIAILHQISFVFLHKTSHQKDASQFERLQWNHLVNLDVTAAQKGNFTASCPNARAQLINLKRLNLFLPWAFVMFLQNRSKDFPCCHTHSLVLSFHCARLKMWRPVSKRKYVWKNKAVVSLSRGGILIDSGFVNAFALH